MDNVIPVKQRRTRRKTNYKNAEQKNTSGLLPRTNKQKMFIDALKENSQVFVLGPAGTGKTYVTATFAADLYITKKIDKIVITRPHVAVGKDLGYLPGTLEEKTYPWALPVLDVLEKHLGKGSVETGLRMVILRWHL
jgi:phosphate starvation-inducible PhoH-like protein